MDKPDQYDDEIVESVQCAQNIMFQFQEKQSIAKYMERNKETLFKYLVLVNYNSHLLAGIQMVTDLEATLIMSMSNLTIISMLSGPEY